MRVQVDLTKRQVDALLRWDALDWPHGCRKSLARQEAEFRLIDALLRARREDAQA